MLKISLDTSGATRMALLTSRHVFKIPSMRSYRLFLNGLLANMTEMELSKVGSFGMSLCPVVWGLPFGLLVVMRRCVQCSEIDTDAINAAIEASAETVRPLLLSDNKTANWGWLDGRLVRFDYGS